MNIGQRRERLGIKIMGICTALVSGIILVQLPSFYKQDVDFQSHAIRATGNVVKTREEEQYSGGGLIAFTSTTKFISTVKFQTNQAELIEFTTSGVCSSRRDCENKEVPVLYDPSLPTDARVDSGSTPESLLEARLVFSLVFLLLGLLVAVLKPSAGNQWNKNLR